MLFENKMIRACLTSGLFFSIFTLSAGASTAPSAAAPPANAAASVPPLILSGRQSDRPAGTYSAGVTEIVQMLDAKVDTSVILAYIQNSPIAYNPDAAELIALKDHGASTEVVIAMMHHGDELRLRLAQALNNINNPIPIAGFEAEPPAMLPSAPAPDSGEVLNPAIPFYTYGTAWPWLCRRPGCLDYCPYWYDRGCWYAHRGDAHPVGGCGGPCTIADVHSSPAQRSISTLGGTRGTAVAARSGGVRVAGHFAAHAGGHSH
jgi:hypothetical protein